MKKLLICVMVVLMVLSLVACSTVEPTKPEEPKTEDKAEPDTSEDKAEEGDVFKIGVYGAMTGSSGLGGLDVQRSVDMYIADINANGGFCGKTVEAIYYDDQGSPEEAVKCATKLVEVDKVDFVIAGFISSCIFASGQILEDAQVPFYVLGLSPSLLEPGWKYMARPTINTDYSIPSITDAMKSFGFTSLAVFEGQDDYGVAAGESMRKAAADAGLTVVTTENYVSGDTDFSGQVAKILTSGADCVFLGVTGGDVGNAIKQFRQFGYDGILFYSEGPQSTALEVAGEACNHLCFCYPYVMYESVEDAAANPLMQNFLQRYSDTYGEFPYSETAFRAWDAMITLERAIKDAGATDGDSIINATYAISDQEALSGTLDFTKTKDGDCLFAFKTWVYVDGHYYLFDEWLQSDDYAAYAPTQGWA